MGREEEEEKEVGCGRREKYRNREDRKRSRRREVGCGMLDVRKKG